MILRSKPVLRPFNYVVLFAAFAAGLPLIAQSIDSHIHGTAELNVAQTDRQVQIEFISPAINLLGFERAPDSAEESAHLNRVKTLLQSSSWLLGDALAECQMSTPTFTMPEFAAESHEHDAQEHAGPDTNSHADFHILYLFECAGTPLKEYRIRAFNHFDGIEKISVQWITASQQGLAELTASEPILLLE